jgi:phosphoenolpyruvate synthase/pyruvate phosphate dikinase
VSSIHLGTKAQTLLSLSGKIATARIEPGFVFPANQWQSAQEPLLDAILSQFVDRPLIVRSSSAREDTASASAAGHYTSVLGICGRDSLANAIDRVIASFESAENEGQQEDEVLIQPMLSNVMRAGVAFSIDPNSGAPYRIINYTEGCSTTEITGGNSGKTYIHARSAKAPAPAKLSPVLALLDELESLLEKPALDIEFAFTALPEGEELVLLQVRQLVLHDSAVVLTEHHQALTRIADKIAQGLKPQPFLHGRSTVYGVMPDWNPAEIIGLRPRPLALSLYRSLITDATWAYQRHNYGYQNLRSFPLLIHFDGQPYIDVRVSFNSFLPRDIEGSLADRLVDYYTDRLLAAPALHDKIEFEIVFSCYTLDLPQRLSQLDAFGFTASEKATLTDSLRHLTNQIIHKERGLWRTDRDKLGILAQRRERILAADIPPVSRIYWLLEDCKRYGTLPFAGLARAGFIAVQMLKSMVDTGIFSSDDYDAFMASLNTVSGQLARDMGTMERTTFLAKYGHLRPGTYDILSPRYDEAPDTYFNWQRSGNTTLQQPAPFSLKLDQIRQIGRLLAEHGLEADVVSLFDFLQAGIELREYAKFLFTRNLSDAMSLMRGFAEDLGFSGDDLSYAEVSVFNELYASCADPKELLMRSIDQGRKRYLSTARIRLPPLITGEQDVWGFHLPETEPNFITQKSVVGPVVAPEDTDRLAGAIVAIRSADPGFDWLFSHPIAGLITAYGGANSHMAIRAGELGLPAVIGAGETLFERWRHAPQLVLDCATHRVVVLP